MFTGLDSLSPQDLQALRDEAQVSKAWPFEEARKLIARYPNGFPAEGVIFETGYGPSGLPHIGTFGEVVRTTMVRRAFQLLCPGVPTRLIAFSDDMDGMRKVPPHLPNQELLKAALDLPLTVVPDPFGTHSSFGAHNNARLRAFLDSFGFEYEFLSSTDCYKSGRFDATLLKVLANYEKIMAVMLPTLGAERQATYSPFLPVSPTTGKVLQVPITARDEAAGTISYADPDTGETITVPVTGGHCKLQWKVDWAMRWVALGVDYEMAGKDLIDSVKLSSQITRILGAKPPEGFNYELFLDGEGAKISKTKGNGLTIEEWLRYAPPESLAFYMFQQPRAAKKLYLGVIPKAMDDYFQFVAAFPHQSAKEQLGNPAFHVHGGPPPAYAPPVPFALLLNLVAVSGATDAAMLGAYLKRYAPQCEPEADPRLKALIDAAIAFHADHVAPTLKRRAPDAREREALVELEVWLQGHAEADAEAIQFEVYEIGKRYGFEPLRSWFQALYEILLGSSQGPRMGTFFALYGVENSRRLIGEALGEVPA
ncbi:lysine--tRNA ligase [Sandaracinobacter neustonicus]|uniref:Lysine--tRNA ligase n=1 Tax=Sandaracinobacter neustonicus TaxID=1715348 RepID=A0A501XVI5_9SPHN|nr:lysine--tRNA ligase [Sandaracinobacter neustonicus]TPE64616.1 lysine--tRNA ligase [Sandaracinobacter neustonicus]